jgi:hypothetical protein
VALSSFLLDLKILAVTNTQAKQKAAGTHSSGLPTIFSPQWTRFELSATHPVRNCSAFMRDYAN